MAGCPHLRLCFGWLTVSVLSLIKFEFNFSLVKTGLPTAWNTHVRASIGKNCPSCYGPWSQNGILMRWCIRRWILKCDFNYSYYYTCHCQLPMPVQWYMNKYYIKLFLHSSSQLLATLKPSNAFNKKNCHRYQKLEPCIPPWIHVEIKMCLTHANLNVANSRCR